MAKNGQKGHFSLGPLLRETFQSTSRSEVDFNGLLGNIKVEGTWFLVLEAEKQHY